MNTTLFNLWYKTLGKTRWLFLVCLVIILPLAVALVHISSSDPILARIKATALLQFSVPVLIITPSIIIMQHYVDWPENELIKQVSKANDRVFALLSIFFLHFISLTLTFIIHYSNYYILTSALVLMLFALPAMFSTAYLLSVFLKDVLIAYFFIFMYSVGNYFFSNPTHSYPFYQVIEELENKQLVSASLMYLLTALIAFVVAEMRLRNFDIRA